jgi:hypothetical protein
MKPLIWLIHEHEVSTEVSILGTVGGQVLSWESIIGGRPPLHPMARDHMMSRHTNSGLSDTSQRVVRHFAVQNSVTALVKANQYLLMCNRKLQNIMLLSSQDLLSFFSEQLKSAKAIHLTGPTWQ